MAQIPAAVVTPVTRACARMTVPAPMKPMPVTIWAATLACSLPGKPRIETRGAERAGAPVQGDRSDPQGDEQRGRPDGGRDRRQEHARLRTVVQARARAWKEGQGEPRVEEHRANSFPGERHGP